MFYLLIISNIGANCSVLSLNSYRSEPYIYLIIHVIIYFCQKPVKMFISHEWHQCGIVGVDLKLFPTCCFTNTSCLEVLAEKEILHELQHIKGKKIVFLTRNVKYDCVLCDELVLSYDPALLSGSQGCWSSPISATQFQTLHSTCTKNKGGRRGWRRDSPLELTMLLPSTISE